MRIGRPRANLLDELGRGRDSVVILLIWSTSDQQQKEMDSRLHSFICYSIKKMRNVDYAICYMTLKIIVEEDRVVFKF